MVEHFCLIDDRSGVLVRGLSAVFGVCESGKGDLAGEFSQALSLP